MWNHQHHTNWFGSSYTHVYSFTPEKWKQHKSNSTIFISLLNTCRFHLQFLHLATDEWKKDWKGGKLQVALSLNFYVIVFIINCWLYREGTWVRRNITGFCGHLCLFSFCSLSKFWLEQNHGLLAPYFLSAANKLWVSLKSHTLKSTGILCLWSILNTTWGWGVRK